MWAMVIISFSPFEPLDAFRAVLCQSPGEGILWWNSEMSQGNTMGLLLVEPL